MKSNITRIALTFVAFAVSLMANAQAQPCSNGTFNGSFGFTNTGTIVGVGDFAAVGLLSADGQGNLGGSITRSVNGVISRLTFTGTYSVNLDCTGSATLTFSSGQIVHRDFVIVDDGKEVRGISTDSGTVVIVNLRKQFTEND
jgi:hypothetical protein